MKIRFTAIWVISLLLLTSTTVALSDDAHNNELKRAWLEINNKNFTGAQAILSDRLKSHPTDIQTQFLYARALAWGGKYSEASSQLDLLIDQYPDNSDYLLTKARVLSWQNKNSQAIDVLERARQISPDYFELWKFQLTLLKREYAEKDRNKVKSYYIKFKQQFSERNIPPLSLPIPIKNRFILSTFNYDNLDNGSTGKIASISYGDYWKKYQYIINMDAINRFDINDQQINLSANTKKKPNLWLSGGISASSQNVLFPMYSIYGKVDYLTNKKWLGSYKLSHQQYKSITVDSNQFSISKRWGQLEPRIALYVTTIDYNDITLVTAAQLTYIFKNRHTLRLSLSTGSELEYIDESTIIYDIKNITLDGKYKVNRDWSFIYALSHHIQGTAYTQNGILTGIQFKF